MLELFKQSFSLSRALAVSRSSSTYYSSSAWTIHALRRRLHSIASGVVVSGDDMDLYAPHNQWKQPGVAAYDFRSKQFSISSLRSRFHVAIYIYAALSRRLYHCCVDADETASTGDVVTSPTASMLSAISSTTLLDDVFNEDSTTMSLETYVASATKHEAALFVLSGTMGNQVGLRSHIAQPPHSVLCDHRAHILEWEAGGVASLSGALVQGVVPSNGLYLTLEDVTKYVVLGDDVHKAPTRVISLENTLGGVIMPLTETKRIVGFAREHDIRIHLDGARLWEAVAAGAGDLTAFTSLFDSVSLCFSKGLGAPVGSILVGSRPFIKRARWIRKSIGGGLRQAGVLTAAARVAMDETFGQSLTGQDGKLRQSHEKARRLGQKWRSLGGRLDKPIDTNMVWLDLKSAGVQEKDFANVATAAGLKVVGPRLVVHYRTSLLLL